MMSLELKKSILGVALLALFADKRKNPAEARQVDQLRAALDLPEVTFNYEQFYRDMLQGRYTLADLAAHLNSGRTRQIAFAVAARVLHAGHATEMEDARIFLRELGQMLQLDGAEVVRLLGHDVLELDIAAILSGAAYSPDTEVRELAEERSMLAAAIASMHQAMSSMGVLQIQMHLLAKIVELHGIKLSNSRLRDFFRSLEGLAPSNTLTERQVFLNTFAMALTAHEHLKRGNLNGVQEDKTVYYEALGDATELYLSIKGEIEKRKRALPPSAITEIVLTGTYRARGESFSRTVRRLTQPEVAY